MRLDSLDVDLQKHCILRDAPPDHELRGMIRDGKAALFWGPLVIPQLHATSLSDLHKKIAYLQEGSSGLVCLLRGQTRDYFSGDMLNVEPAAYRDPDLKLRLRFGSEDILRAVERWEMALEPFGLPLTRGLEFTFDERGDPPDLIRWLMDRRPATRLSNNPIFLAVLKHYGFPTNCLDVTTSLSVALWFAAHRAIKDESGRILFQNISSPLTEQTEPLEGEQLRHLPSIYVYFQTGRHHISNLFLDTVTEGPLVDLSGLAPLQKIAQRPPRQAAWSLPFETVGPFTNLRMSGGPKIERYDCPRRPCAVIKILFQIREITENSVLLNGDHLFPKDEPLYRALLEADVPFIAKYS